MKYAQQNFATRIISKRLITALILLLLTLTLTFPVLAQHSVSLAWVASTDSASAYNLYRAAGTCAAPALPWGKINTTPIQGISFTDATGVQIGAYCYYATAVLNGKESVSSNFADAVILPAAPTNVVATPH